MTEKRFTQKDEDNWEILDRNKHFAYAHGGRQAEKIIQELNELVETNRELYKDNKQLKQGLNDDLELIGQLQEENEQLKQQIGNLEHTRDFCAECCERLEKENEELKSEIRKVQRAYEQLWEHTYK